MAWNDAPPTAEEINNTPSKNNWNDAPPTSEELQSSDSTPEESGMLGKAYDFASKLPTSAIDLVPGMKDRRENVEAYRQTPTYKNTTAIKGGKFMGMDVPDQTNEQADEARKAYAESEANDPGMMFAGAVGPHSLLDIAKSVPGIGRRIAAIAPKLETGASRLATEAVGMQPLKDIPRTFNPETGAAPKQYFESKGIGKTAMDEDVLPMTGGMRTVASNAQESIGRNSKELNSLLTNAQEKLNANLEQNMEQAGDLGTKLGENLSGFRQQAPNISSKNALLSKIDRTYLPRIQEIANKDGDLLALQAEKQKLYDDATALSKNAYGPNASTNESELTFVQSMARIVKEQIEKLTEAADPGAAEKVKELNQNMSHMMDFQKSAEKKITPSNSLVDVPSRIMTGFTNKQLGTIAAAKAMSGAAKAAAAPTSTLVEKTPQIARQVMNPFSSSSSTDGQAKATTKAGRLYNATNDSLKSFAGQIKQEPSLTHAADELNSAIDAKDEQRKNNAIFLLLQKSATEKYLK